MSLTTELSEIAAAAFEAEGLPRELGRVQRSDRPDLAQFQCNGALAAAKIAKAPPRDIAEAVATRLRAADAFADISLAGPGFINLTVTDDFLAERARRLAGDARLGGWRTPTPEKIVFDYGGPNVAKPMHVGHLRSAIIGNALVRIFRFAGDEAIGDVHLGDWGLQMGQIISELEIERPDLPYFDETKTDDFPAEAPVAMADLEVLYPRASAACKADEARLARARRATADLQAGRPGYRALWRHFVDVSIAAIKADYKDLGVEFELWKGESDVDPLIPDMLAELDAKGLVELDQGARIVRVAREGDNKELPPAILVTSDGTVVYATTDIATILDRKRSINPDRMIYVVDQRQADHFEQVYRAAALAGYFDEGRLEHIGFGTMQGPDRKPFKTRAGGVMKLRDLLEMVRERAAARISEAGLAADYDAGEVAGVAHKVGVAALKFADLSNYRGSDYVFELDRFMAFEGKTGPYLQYAAVRIKSILRKAKEAGDSPAPGAIRIVSDAERGLALELAAFSDAVRGAYEKRAPNILCDFVFALAQAFSKFYGAHHIMSETDDALRASRLALADATGRQIELVLTLLGIETPERM